MKVFRLFCGSLLVFYPSVLMAVPDALSKGMAAFEARRWSEAMESFLDTLRQDPQNSQAHAYVTLIVREMAAAREADVRAERLGMLGAASKHLEQARRDSGPIEQAILQSSQSSKSAQEAQWQSRCEEARMERQGGHLLSANDLILQVLAENPSYAEAQRELSDLQSRIRQILDAGTSASIVERYALEGFYAYGQADFAAAYTAWGKVQTLLEQSYPGPEAAHRFEELRVGAYAAIARARVEEDKRLAQLKGVFDGAVELYRQKHFVRALDEFRKLAISDPEYPQLGYYLVQAEAASEHERAERLGEEKRQQVERSLHEGLAALEKERFQEAEKSFEQVLRIDPSHPQARAYLTIVRAQAQKRHDPKAAQLHYEAGLIAYASGKLDEALREWHIAARLNPRHEKVQNALAKVQKELALNKRELTDEPLP